VTSFRLTLPGTPRHVKVVIERGLNPSSVRRDLRAPTTLLVADQGAYEVHEQKLQAVARTLGKVTLEPLLIPGEEASKSADRLPEWWRNLRDREVGRDCLLIAAGGGAVLDLAGFLASTWQRGLSHLVVPTTLLAAVDAALGGKTGVNLDGAKNQVGTFKHPEAVLVDPDLLGTLPPDVWASGLGEVLKTGLLAGGELLDTVRAFSESPIPESPDLDRVIEGCLRFKAQVVEQDETESSGRMILNLGHTIGHILETLALDQQKLIGHGIAVAAGLRAEVASFSGDAAMLEDVDDLMHIFGLPATVYVRWDADRARAILLADKKRRAEGLRMPILNAPGSVSIETYQADRILPAAAQACSIR